jgi:hypothetical protein
MSDRSASEHRLEGPASIAHAALCAGVRRKHAERRLRLPWTLWTGPARGNVPRRRPTSDRASTRRDWSPAVKAATRSSLPGSVFEGLTFHLLRHTAASLMARAGMDPAAAAERLGHSEGGALFLRRYRHLYEAEKRLQVARLESFVREHLDTACTDDADELEGNAQPRGCGEWAHLGSNQGPPACEAGALPLSYAPESPTRIPNNISPPLPACRWWPQPHRLDACPRKSSCLAQRGGLSRI